MLNSTQTVNTHLTLTTEAESSSAARPHHQQWLNKQAFNAFVSNPKNKPKYCAYGHGTKYPGNVTLLHFVVYAILRGKSPAVCTHDVTSEKYTEVCRRLTRETERVFTQLAAVFGETVTLSQFKEAIKKHVV